MSMALLHKRLRAAGLTFEKMEHIMRVRKCQRKPLLRGLPEKIVERVSKSFPPSTLKGSKSSSTLGESL